VAKITLGQFGSQGDAHFGASGLGSPTVGSQDYGFYSAHNAYRTSTGAWKHSRTGTIPAVRLLGSGGASSGNQGFSFDYSANVGTANITWTNLMQILPSGNVGIGTNSPLGKLQVNEYTVASQGNQTMHGEVSVFADNGDESLFLGLKDSAYPNRGWAFNPVAYGINSSLQIKEHGSTAVRMTIQSGGNVGIGTTSPSYPFSLESDTTGLISRIYNTNTAGQGLLIRAGATTSSNRVLQVASSNDTKIMTVNSNGRVGIGTISPSNPLHVFKNATIGPITSPTVANAGLRIQDNGASLYVDGNSLATDSAGYLTTINNNNFDIGTNSTSRIHITGGGNVGIGTTGPSEKLHVVGDQLIFGDLLLEGSANSFRTVSMNTVDGSDNQTLYLCGGQTASTSRGGLVQIAGNEVATTGGSVLLKAGNVSTGDIDFYTANTQRMIINNAGNVGIGTTTPNAKLDIQGTQGQLFSVTDDLSGSIFAVSDISGVPIFDVNSSGVSYFDGNVGIGTTSPAKKLHVKESTTATYAAYIENSIAGGDYLAMIGDAGDNVFEFDSGGTGGEAQMKMYSDGVLKNLLDANGSSYFTGSVGIGTASPGYKLDVNGNARLTGGVVTSSSQTRDKISVWSSLNTYTIGMMSGYGYGGLGGNSTGTDYAMSFQMSNTANRGWWWGSTGQTNLRGAMSLTTTGKAVIATSLTVGYGESTRTAATTYALDVTGTIRATGDVIAYSDVRVKENIKTIYNSLEKVSKLRGVEFNKIGDNKKSIGVIAQEIEKVIPEVVKIDDKGMKSVAYGNISGLLIEAIKELKAEI
jgi:hypothetical protein